MLTSSKINKFFAPKNRSTLFIIWLCSVIAYDGARAIVINHFFSRHGVNGWDYFVFELIISIFFAWASFQLIVSIVDSRPKKSLVFGVLTTIAFFAPDAYIVFVGRGAPTTLYAGLALYLSVTTVFTIKSLHKDVHNKRQEKHCGKNKPREGESLDRS